MKYLFPYRWMLVGDCCFFLYTYNSFFWWGVPACLRPCLNTYVYGMYFKPFFLLVGWSIPCCLFDMLTGVLFSVRGRFFKGSIYCSISTTLWNVDTASSILLPSLWNLTVLLLLSSSTLFLSLVFSFSITAHSTC